MRRIRYLRGLTTTMFLVATIFPYTLSAQDRTNSPIGQLGAKPDATFEEVFQLYRQPPREYATAPLWVWNDMLSEKQIRDSLRDFASQGVMQVFVHPRPGLMTPYLSEDWFRLWRTALDEAEKLDMNVWIYDENSYPSGFAGGLVPEEMPESRGYGLAFHEMSEVRGAGGNVLGVWRMSENDTAATDVTAQARTAEGVKDGKYLVVTVNRAVNGGWYGNRCYVDLMDRAVTERFISVTLEAYKKNVGDQFGKRIHGVFTDEPQIIPAGLPWTSRYFEEFSARRGYSLREKLPAITRPVGDWKKVRHDYYKTNHELFVQNWAQPYYEWCSANGLAFTGHYWDHDFPHLSGVPDSMTMASWQQIPGIDCLMNNYTESTNAQFGNIRFCKEMESVAKQFGRQRMLCEAYGAGGWDLRFEDMKRIADWLIANGVNLFDEHLSYTTLRGARKADHPQSFSYHEPWWEGYHNVSRYIQRLCAVLSQGRTVYDIVVLEPTGTAWMLQGTGECNHMANRYFELLLGMSKRQIEYDIGAENTFREIASIGEQNGEPTLVLGKCSYRTVIIPEGTETLESFTVELLKTFVEKGGRVISIGRPPQRVEAIVSDEVENLSKAESWIRVADNMDFFHIANDAVWASPDTQRMVNHQSVLGYHMRRQIADGEILFVANTDMRNRLTLDLRSVGFDGARILCAMDGTVSIAGETETLPPVGSILLVRTPQMTTGEEVKDSGIVTLKRGHTTAKRIGPNVLTLDYCDLQSGSGTYENIHYNRACRQIWKDAGFEQNPWDSQVQFGRELIDREFPDDSGFTVSFRFTIDGEVPSELDFVLERPDLYEITLNGQKLTCPVTPSEERDVAIGFENWWLDRASGKMDISGIAESGENVVTCSAKKMTCWHEIQAAFVIGDFSLESRERGFAIVPPEPIDVRTDTAQYKTDRENISWLSSGMNFRPGTSLKNDDAPWLEFTFAEPTDLDSMSVWNYNEGPANGMDLSRRGIRKVRILASENGTEWRDPVEKNFAKATGTQSQNEEIVSLGMDRVLKLRFEILENHMGVTYPATSEASKTDNAFVGLGEIRFHSKKSTSTEPVFVPVKDVAASSELIVDGHHRPVSAIIDGSGFTDGGIGWNRQGLPFYAEGVAYTMEFTTDQDDTEARYFLPLTREDWSGSTARIVVNGREAGWVVLSETSFNITPFVQDGNNTVELTVIGTLRNTLGPLHSGQHQFSAWPGMFHQAPETQPAGDGYGTLGYGLFRPLKVIVTH
ncbi:MAG: glycosyl hydrolase [Planctomycetia bacterium]|nr:glycosyl hydrolase [Planctomycetia bacterium]